MAIVVVGGGGRGTGKTALVCGVIAALPERRWVGVKIASHPHEREQQLWEETVPGDEKDTARYLAAGAHRAFLLTVAADEDMNGALLALWNEFAAGTNYIFESNRVLEFVKPDLCLVLAGDSEEKASFETALQHADAIVVGPGSDDLPGWFATEACPVFRLEGFDKLTPELAGWIRGQLIYG